LESCGLVWFGKGGGGTGRWWKEVVAEEEVENSRSSVVVVVVANRLLSFFLRPASPFPTHLPRDVQLLLGRQRGPGALLPVPERRVEDADVVRVGDAARDVVGAREAFLLLSDGRRRRRRIGRRCGGCGGDDDAV
jgi:hypothetical protein